MIFNRTDYDNLYTLFDPEAQYKGYRPAVKENAGGKAIAGGGYRYLHVAPKYTPPEWAVRLLARAHYEACRIADALGVPAAYMPSVQNGTLRVLEYPPGSSIEPHIDYDLFTVSCFRETPGDLVLGVGSNITAGEVKARGVNPLLQIGGLAELLGLAEPTTHFVRETDYVQRSIVYFAAPAMNTPLPAPVTFPRDDERGFAEVTVTTTGQWQLERTERGRVYG